MQLIYLESLVIVCCDFVSEQIWQFETQVSYFQPGDVCLIFLVLSWPHLDFQLVHIKK